MPPLPKGLSKGEWSEQASKVLGERYLMKDAKGKIIETPEDMCWRVSWEAASAEALWGRNRKEVKIQAKEYYKLFTEHVFLPNSPTLMNAGTDNNLQYSGCFVLPVEDSIRGIFESIKNQALIHQSGGGTGFSFNRLRPQGSMVKRSGGVASGPISFMRIFDAATNEVKQGGKRRGANMGILRVDHPDILDFIHCKEEGGLTNFNISVAITDKFMEAYKKNKKYDLIDPNTKKKASSLLARKVFNEIADSAWKTGDPGLVFIDRRNRESSNPVPSMGPIEATNPCGEQELYPFDACNLGSIFLTYFIKEENGEKIINWEKLKNTTRIAVRFLDSIIEVNPLPLEEIRRTVLGIRRIGLGVGGWADMLIDLGIPYDSDEAVKLGEKVMKTIQEEAVSASQEIAKERGPFPLWPVSIYKNEKPRRNSTVTTIAPTGTISIIAGASSGIEPLFAIAFRHIVKDKHLDRTLTFINPRFEALAKERGFWSEDIKQKVAERGTVRKIKEVPEEVRGIFGTAHEIHHDWHIKMQAAFQKYTENAVSKTINMRSKIAVKDIKEAYLLAWEFNCKGITVFRDGCKGTQVLNMGTKDVIGKKELEIDGSMQVRPFKVIGATYKLKTPVGTAFVTINENEKRDPLEVFINVGKAGTDVAAMAEALGRTISTALRLRGASSPRERAEEVAFQLSGIGGRRSVGFGPKKIRSLPDAIAVALSSHFGFKINGNGNHVVAKDSNGEVGTNLVANASVQTEQVRHADTNDPTSVPTFSKDSLNLEEATKQISVSSFEIPGDLCPSCGASALVFEEGCSKCYACGHSEC
ncbi:vitamin B12-dependent ribonucleotide reductase [Patescibacteria group bacterium]|nr:vitamin B12-dependent ribonucleotide reductase [Patescibacteria group bacterium]MBU0777412.1 vitamin B12-dependent ribonucleotide reductase [Patescibacteria group bacterium]MBU0846048.1 vitamin B12-dependent ribonucleotide reductase [Patescibacteria group bacterium]MBU0922452.1 vitamin B12-dependent ribonucleotide reductase [Patescibacteria group bacterium]MBU1066815.1 vitamin B12-dependent ribonucleotide reductase [Patescibacteria group bacterium]